MVLTVLEAQVAADREQDLRREFALTAKGPLPPFIVRSTLVRGLQDQSLWRILTVFRTREALEAMRASGEVPRGVAMFRAAGVEPNLAVYEIADEFENVTAK